MRIFEVKRISYQRFYNDFLIDLYGKDSLWMGDIFKFKINDHIYTFKELNDREKKILSNPDLKELRKARSMINCRKYISGFKMGEWWGMKIYRYDSVKLNDCGEFAVGSIKYLPSTKDIFLLVIGGRKYWGKIFIQQI